MEARAGAAASAESGSSPIRAGAWGVLDQALVSGVNFLTIILLARALAPADFGYFVLAFTVLQTVGTLQGALVTRPHNVLGSVRRGVAYADYSTTVAAAQGGFAALLAAVGCVAAALAYVAGSEQASLLAALVPALAAWQLQELGRRMLYTERRLAAAFGNDLVAYGGHAVALVALWQFDRLTGPAALWTLAGMFAVGAGLLAWQLRYALTGALQRASLTATWRFGKWLGLAEVGQWLSTHFYVYLAAAIIGPVTSAALKAAQTLLGPVSVFLTFVTSYLPVVLARELEATGTIGRTLRRSVIAVVAAVLPYCVLVTLFAGPALELVYGPDYRRYADVTQLFALYYALLAVSTVVVAALSARRLTRAVFVGHAAGAALSVAVGWLLLDALGATGAVVGMLLSWTLGTALFAIELRRGGSRAPMAVSTADALAER